MAKTTVEPLVSAFPYNGGKSEIGEVLWQAFGRVDTFVEPFAGSLAALFACPYSGIVETVNDKDCLLVNFHRAVKYAPKQLAEEADYPCTEADLAARAKVVRGSIAALREKIYADPKYHDVELAAYWVYGMCWSIASKFIIRKNFNELPALGDKGRGFYRESLATSKERRAYILRLSERLRRVRIACGEWDRVVKPSITTRFGVAAILFDPPYSIGDACYNENDKNVAQVVREWCKANGSNPNLRLALCGYEGEHEELLSHGWRVYKWKARGGFSVQSKEEENSAYLNAYRERVFFSPHTLYREVRQITFLEED